MPSSPCPLVLPLLCKINVQLPLQHLLLHEFADDCFQGPLHLRRAETKGNDPKGSMCGYMAVPVHTYCVQKSEALIRPNDVHNVLPLVGHAKVLEANHNP